MFTSEELKNIIEILEMGPDYIEVECGCTNPRIGDTGGKLRIFAGGRVEITCQCIECSLHENSGKKISPLEFAKHAGRPDPKNWKSQIWVYHNEEGKIKLWRTALLKYYKETIGEAEGSRRRQSVHRDEFIRCSRCSKERRFHLRNQEECRIYHDAVANGNWGCSDMPYGQITCSDIEERNSRKPCRGCPVKPKCKGCTSCVCFGCLMCRFADCDCRTCVDFIQNQE